MSKVFAFIKDEPGATAIEYGLIAAGISVVIIATVNAIGTTLNTKSNRSRPSSSNTLRVAESEKAAFTGGFFVVVRDNIRTGYHSHRKDECMRS